MTDATAKSPFADQALGDARRRAYAPDAKALEHIYRQYWSELCKYVFKTFGPGPPDPEDVAQAAFAKYAVLDNPGEIENTRAYLYRTARNIVLEHKRKDKVVDAYIDDVLNRAAGISLEELTPERILIEKDRFQAVNRAFEGLARKQKIVLTLKQYHGATFAEITAKTGWSTGDVARQLNTALDILGDALHRYDRRGASSRKAR